MQLLFASCALITSSGLRARRRRIRSSRFLLAQRMFRLQPVLGVPPFLAPAFKIKAGSEFRDFLVADLTAGLRIASLLMSAIRCFSNGFLCRRW